MNEISWRLLTIYLLFLLGTINPEIFILAWISIPIRRLMEDKE